MGCRKAVGKSVKIGNVHNVILRCGPSDGHTIECVASIILLFRTAYILSTECYYNYQSLFFYLFKKLHVNVHFNFVKFSDYT
jgi:hypothetical protein